MPKIGSNLQLKEESFRMKDPGTLASQAFESAGDAYVVALKEKVLPSEDEIQKQLPDVKNDLSERRRDAAVDAFLKDLKAKAQIRLDREKLAQLPTA